MKQTAMKRSAVPFVVGRTSRKGTTVVLLRVAETPPLTIPGPWTLRALVAPTPAR